MTCEINPPMSGIQEHMRYLKSYIKFPAGAQTWVFKKLTHFHTFFTTTTKPQNTWKSSPHTLSALPVPPHNGFCHPSTSQSRNGAHRQPLAQWWHYRLSAREQKNSSSLENIKLHSWDKHNDLCL